MLVVLLVAAAMAGQYVPLNTEDGKLTYALVEKAAGSKRGVVLVHMEGRTSADWAETAGRLAGAKMTAIAPDLRGHGRSGSGATALIDADYQAMLFDVKASIAWLKKNGVTEVSCVGASIGANLCLEAAAKDPSVANVAVLSPGLNIHGVKASEAMDGYGPRPVLFVVSQDDAYSAKTVTLLEPKAMGQHHTELFEAAGHGTKMLSAEASLEGTLLSWLLGTYRLSSGEMVLPSVDVQARTESIQTTGQKLDVHQTQ